SARRRLGRDGQPRHPGVFDADGAHRTARHRLRDDLPVHDHGESHRRADRRPGRGDRRRLTWKGAAVQDHWSAPKSNPAPQLVTFDAVMPATMATRAEESGVKKAATDPLTLLVLSVLAGAFIAFGAIFATTVSAGSVVVTAAGGAPAASAALPYGIVRLL